MLLDYTACPFMKCQVASNLRSILIIRTAESLRVCRNPILPRKANRSISNASTQLQSRSSDNMLIDVFSDRGLGKKDRNQ